MKLQDLWDIYQSYTKEMTKQLRYLSVAGIAICWAFRAQDAFNTSGQLDLPTLVAFAMLMFIVFFLLDITQYFTGALLHRFWIFKVEEYKYQNNECQNDECTKPRWLDYPAYTLFLLKTATALIAFSLVARYFYTLL
ncbi:hypothetical protein DSCA_13650 [Desulfosarcina alkanivorans]|uniref:Uncharacterized protein n=1 Tax=Desulfosarcina alkanivorans TaxID=571177 RepID=A0A5K7YG27_9BACT|nr:hypothetical protein [Desulfosarcina alkanivorans]BBO67435.1 hypothetical protein DSCA_13650 [Desulfosarcina alkanivorans]